MSSTSPTNATSFALACRPPGSQEVAADRPRPSTTTSPTRRPPGSQEVAADRPSTTTPARREPGGREVAADRPRLGKSLQGRFQTAPIFVFF